MNCGEEKVRALCSDVKRPFTQVRRELEIYAQLLKKWQPVQNLVSRETLNDIWHRHFLDSIQLLPLTRPEDRLVLDLGSGAGFPALPLAVVLKERDIVFELYEPVGRKASFLRTVVRELELRVVVHAERIEQRDSRETPDVITSRALAPLDQLLRWIAPHIQPNTRCLLHKGRGHDEEIVKATTHFRFDVIEHASLTDASAAILEVSNLRGKSEA